ncbi:MAG: hypothetical protein AB1898_04390 [Acidobacteriota bacterium]
MLEMFSLVLSAVALGVSLYTLWVTRVSPYRLLVYPPVISLLGERRSTLALEFTFLNPGRTPVVLFDLEANVTGPASSLQPKRFRPHALCEGRPAGGLNFARREVITHFTPVAVKAGETVNKRIYFIPADHPGLEGHVQLAQTERIELRFHVNGRWNKKTFRLDCADLQPSPDSSDLAGLVPPSSLTSLLPKAQPLFLRGSIFDPVP